MYALDYIHTPQCFEDIFSCTSGMVTVSALAISAGSIRDPLNFLAGVPRSNKTSSSAKVKPLVSGSRKNVQVMHRAVIPAQKKPTLADQFHAVELSMYGVRIYSADCVSLDQPADFEDIRLSICT